MYFTQLNNILNRFANIIQWFIRYILMNTLETLPNGNDQNSFVPTPQQRLRAGGLVAQEIPGGTPYKALNIRRGNAMRYLVLDYIKQKPYRGKHILLPALSEEKRKAMEHIAAQAFFGKIDAYNPEEHFFPLHVKPSGELYYIPEKKVEQMLYVVNKLKKHSLESIVSDVTWESSSSSEEEDRYILDFKTEKVLANANRCEQLINEIEKFYYTKDERVGDVGQDPTPGRSDIQPGRKAHLALRRSSSLPILVRANDKKIKQRLSRSPVLSKAASDDNLNILSADINQHNLVCAQSIENVVKNEKNEAHIKELMKMSDEAFNQPKQVRFAPDLQKRSKKYNINDHMFIESEGAIPSTSGGKQRKQKKETADDINQHNLTALYDEIDEIKASAKRRKEKGRTKGKMRREDLNWSVGDIDQHKLSTALSADRLRDFLKSEDLKETSGDNAYPSTSGEQEKMKSKVTIEDHSASNLGPIDEEDLSYTDDSVDEYEKPNRRKKSEPKSLSDLYSGERFLLEKIMKNERIMNKSEQMVKMKIRSQNVKPEIDIDKLTDEQFLKYIKSKPKRFNIYTLQNLQTEFDASEVGDTQTKVPTNISDQAGTLNTPSNQSDILSVTNQLVSEIEMRNFTKKDDFASCSKKERLEADITDSDVSETEANVSRKHGKKLKKKAVKFSKHKKVIEPNVRTSFGIASHIPLIGRFFQKKT